jgi:hypothetical protein
VDTHTEAHSGSPKVALEGTYSPPDYLEEVVSLKRPDYTTTIAEGRIEVLFREPQPLPDADRQVAVTREVRQVFQARMILTGRSSEMTGLTLSRRYPDGRRDVWVSVASLICVASVRSPDIILKDAEGNVVKDTKAERLADERGFQEQCLRHADNPLLSELMASFSRAVADPGDRMTHLYEIRDALSRHFGGERQAKNTLDLTKTEWSHLGRIANDEPIEESRHRGKHPALRPATEDEQTRVLEIARRMIRAYLAHLDRTPTV